MEQVTVIKDDDPEDRWNRRDVPPLPPGRPTAPAPVVAVVEPGKRSLIDPDEVMRVGAGSPPQAVASSIQRYIVDEMHMPTIRAIGAGAVAQTCKGIAIARGYLAVKGVDLGCNIGFTNVLNDEGEEISAQTFHLFFR